MGLIQARAIIFLSLHAVLLIPLVLAGCAATASTSPGTPGAEPAAKTTEEPVEPEKRIVAMSLQAMPTAINWDSEPGPDGLQVRLFLFTSSGSESVTLGRGEVDFLLFEGRVAEGQVATTPPFHQWSFTSAQLATVRGQGLIGWSYEPPLAWGKHVPKTHTVTLIVRVRQPGVPPLYSAPTLLQVS